MYYQSQRQSQSYVKNLLVNKSQELFRRFEQNINPRSNQNQQDISFNNSQQQEKIFTSKYREVRPHEIYEFLNQYRIKHNLKGSEIVLVYCPLCHKPHHNDPSNLNTCGINSTTGQYNCFRCSNNGSWFDFKNKMLQKHFGTSPSDLVQNQSKMMMGNSYPNPYMQMNLSYGNNNNYYFGEDQEMKSQEQFNIIEAHKFHQQLTKEIYPEINSFLTGTESKEQRHIRKEILEIFKIGVGKEKFRNDSEQISFFESVYFPLYAPKSKKNKKKQQSLSNNHDINKLQQNQQEEMDSEAAMNTEEYELVKMKIRAIGSDNKHRMKLMPAGSELRGLFGLTTVGKDDKVIVITEGEYDAMAVYQEIGLPAVSLPNGANHLPVQFLPFFERFERIYLWLDADDVGRSSAEKFAEKLGVKRTIIIDSKLNNEEGPKDANDALRMKMDFRKIFVECSRTLADSNLLKLADLKPQIMRRILNFNELSGVASQYFSFFNKTIKGFRKGELSILTGATGSGKTTFLSQLSIDFLTQGVPTLWGSFEIKNEILASTMLQQFSQTKLVGANAEQIEYQLEKFEQHPLYFLNFYGSTQIDLLFETLDYAIYAYDIQFICLDNMQFMLSQQAQGFQKFDLQDKVTSMLRQLATERNVHIAVVIHPKKVEDDNNLNVGSIFGSAKVTQEADNVFILQKNNIPHHRILQVKKNRFDGEVGEVSMLFNTDNKRYLELEQEEKKLLLINNGSAQKILQARKDKFGTYEPTAAVKAQLEKENRVLVKPVVKEIKDTKQLADRDVKFYQKTREHIRKNEPIENNISTKTRHQYFTSGSDESEGSGDDNDGSAGSSAPPEGDEFLAQIPSTSAQTSTNHVLNIVVEDIIDYNNDYLDDLTLNKYELELTMKQGSALTIDQLNSQIIPDQDEQSVDIISDNDDSSKLSQQVEEQKKQQSVVEQDNTITSEQLKAIKEFQERLYSQSIEPVVFNKVKNYYNRSKDEYDEQNDNERFLQLVAKKNSSSRPRYNYSNRQNYQCSSSDDQQYSYNDKKRNQPINIESIIDDPNEVYDKYDNPRKIPLNKSDQLNKFVSPELKRYMLPYERHYVYTREADDSTDEDVRLIAITKDQYENVEQLMRPNYLRKANPKESFYEDITSIEDIKKKPVQIGSVLQPGAKLLKSQTPEQLKITQDINTTHNTNDNSQLQDQNATVQQSKTDATEEYRQLILNEIKEAQEKKNKLNAEFQEIRLEDEDDEEEQDYEIDDDVPTNKYLKQQKDKDISQKIKELFNKSKNKK